MTTLLDLPRVQACSVSSCGYNHDGCHAGAVTIASPQNGSHAHCVTFIDISTKGGLDMVAAVGACTRSDCIHNNQLACQADSIRVGQGEDPSDCLTYAPR